MQLPTSYTLAINEAQRKLITAALTSLRPDQVTDLLEDCTAPEELLLLRAMFEQLPAQEAESPGCLHGLCL